jgi:aminoglycoside 3-N-acetyltransferase
LRDKLKKKSDFNKLDIINNLKEISIKKNDTVFIQSNLGFFGKLENADDVNSLCQIFKEAIFEVIGTNGTLIVPTYSYSFCNNQIYNKEKTLSKDCGIFSEFIRLDPKSERSDDANFSVAAIGKNAKEITTNSPEHSFGKNSFWDKFLSIDGILCRFNLQPNYMSIIHFVEKSCNVTYRWDKSFKGKSIINGQEENKRFIHFVRDLDKEEHSSELSELQELCIKEKIMKISDLGRGKIYCIRAKDYVSLAKQEIEKNEFFIVKGKKGFN